ncbi:Hypothetical protein VV1_1458 [Vibrio vulnificus CMCP6]|uniref:Uncharacterized protein n=2 Tax=Vibrio vulnificus TaxID=672 RepID=A0A3Q0L3M7_VIBVU|nr:Hypothetical protein VV1_1458 [Vibrio vulnificus CMCP6]
MRFLLSILPAEEVVSIRRNIPTEAPIGALMACQPSSETTYCKPVLIQIDYVKASMNCAESSF